MSNLLPPFNPYRRELYHHSELLAGFDSADPQTFLHTPDFTIYRHFRQNGGSEAEDYFVTMMQALHDQAVTQAIRKLLNGRRCAAIMGGHKMARNHPEYRRVAQLSGELTNAGFVVASGGGPGAMEATHLGASLSNLTPADLETALDKLKTIPDLPANLPQILNAAGEPDPEVCAAAHRWYAPAIEIARQLKSPPVSLAIPTWHYGHEPATPLASHIGKYFQNSIREDGLLTFAVDGIIFTEGKAGTIQEIFQDAAQNYYRSVRGRFSPMVFLGIDYWTNHYPVNMLLHALFHHDDYSRYVLFTDHPEEAVDFLVKAN